MICSIDYSLLLTIQQLNYRASVNPIKSISLSEYCDGYTSI